MNTAEEIKKEIESHIPSTLTIEGDSLIIPKENLKDVALFLKTSPDYEMDFLSCLTGIDYKDHLEVVYHLYSMSKKHGPLTLKIRTDRETAKVPSVTSVWRSAEFQEREAYDLLGIHFEGHPDLRRILMWEGFEHYPLRKDYVPDDQDRDTEKF